MISPFDTAEVDSTVVVAAVVVEDAAEVASGVDGTVVDGAVLVSTPDGARTGSATTTITVTEAETSATIATRLSQAGTFVILRRLCFNILPITE